MSPLFHYLALNGFFLRSHTQSFSNPAGSGQNSRSQIPRDLERDELMWVDDGHR